MLFQDKHVAWIREHEKTVTRRVWAENYPRPNPGSVHMAAATSMIPDDADYDSPLYMPITDCTCFIRISEDYAGKDDRQRLGDMTDADAQKEGDYETVAEFKESWRRINAGWDPDVLVDVVPFSYHGRTPE